MSWAAATTIMFSVCVSGVVAITYRHPAMPKRG